MVGVGHRGVWLRVALAITLALCAWVRSLMCFSLHGLHNNVQDAGVDQVTAVGGQRGKILFDGKDPELHLESSSAATGKLLNIILGHLAPSGLWGKTSEKEDSTIKEAWKHLKPVLHCGQKKMEFRATGHTAADLQLDIGLVDPLPLNRLPENCGYTMGKHAHGFVLAVSYNGCNVIQENGNYVLKMRWHNTSVEFICSIMSSSVSPQSTQEPNPIPERSLRVNRHRRSTGQVYYPCSLYDYSACLNYYYYLYMKNLALASYTQTTTAAPQTAPPVRGYNQFPYYYPYYNPYYSFGNTPVTVPPYSGCDSSTAQSPQCSQSPPGHSKWPYNPSSGPIKPGFPGSPLLQQQIPQKHPGYPYPTYPQTGKPHDPTVQKPCQISTTPAPATVTPTPCPSQGRPINASCLGVVSTYVPYTNLTFKPYISYRAGKPAKDEQNIPQTGVGVQPRSFHRMYHPYETFSIKPYANYMEHMFGWYVSPDVYHSPYMVNWLDTTFTG